MIVYVVNKMRSINGGIDTDGYGVYVFANKQDAQKCFNDVVNKLKTSLYNSNMSVSCITDSDVEFFSISRFDSDRITDCVKLIETNCE